MGGWVGLDPLFNCLHKGIKVAGFQCRRVFWEGGEWTLYPSRVAVQGGWCPPQKGGGGGGGGGITIGSEREKSDFACVPFLLQLIMLMDFLPS